MGADLHSQASTRRQAGDVADVVCLYYPQQVLPALAALLTDRRRHGQDLTAPACALLWSQQPDPTLRETRRAVVERLLGAFPWIRLWAPGHEETARSLSARQTVAAKARFLRDQFGRARPNAIFYPHDLTSDFLPGAVSLAYPHARRVCFGDGLGMVYSRPYFDRHLFGAGNLSGLLTTPGTALRRQLARLRRRWTRDAWRPADDYVLILPHDPSGDCLSAGGLTVVPYACAQGILEALTATVADQARAAATSLAGAAAAAPLVLLGAYVESRMCSEHDEIALYHDVLRAHVPPGAPLVLKPHAAASANKVRRVTASLSPEYNAVVVDRDLAETPVELLGALVDERPVLSFSHASVALAYFALGEVRHVLTEELIARHFPPFIRPWMIESNRQYLQQQRAADRARRLLGTSE